VGLTVIAEETIGALLYPAFAARKRLNRTRPPDDVTGGVRRQIVASRGSRIGRLTERSERARRRVGIKLPFGIRGLTVLEGPAA
jgi:hypothetical protein